MSSKQGGLLRLIAVFKLLKAALLIVAGIGILRMMHGDIANVLEHWVMRLGLDPGNRYIDRLLAGATNLPPHKIGEFGAGSLIYAGLFLTEGIGLWLQKRWGEWATVIITGSGIPLEVYEIHRHLSALKIVVLVINVAVVGYLIYRIRKENADHQNEAQGRTVRAGA